jgi:HD superfamily phosphodiesterase
MDRSDIIRSAENQYKQILEEFFTSVYNEISLSSHGIDHHRRVWNYAKEFLKQIPSGNTSDILRFSANLIIACYLHDTGMSVDPGPKHGKLSRRFCTRFLSQHNLSIDDFHDALEAIENHDNKDYATIGIKNDLLKILSVSDDLDAFGLTGIFRYTEIYLARGIEPDKIGILIRENAERRFLNFLKSFGSYNEIVEKHTPRYKILDEFFSKYNAQLSSYQFGSSNPSGYCGVIELFDYMIKRRIELKEIYLETEKYLVDPIIRWFFTELASELIVEHTAL